MLSIPCLMALSVNLLALLPAASPLSPAPLLTPRSEPPNPGYNLAVEKLFQGAQAAWESINQKYPPTSNNPPRPASFYLVASYAPTAEQPVGPSGFVLVRLDAQPAQPAFLDAPALTYVQPHARIVVTLELAPAVTSVGAVAARLGAQAVVEGWVVDDGLFERAVRLVNRARCRVRDGEVGEVAYRRVMEFLWKSSGFVELVV